MKRTILAILVLLSLAISLEIAPASAGSTQSSGNSIVGKWIGHLDGESVLSDGTTKSFSADYITTYNSDGTYIEEAIRYNSDGTYSFVGLPDYIYTGKWIQNGNTIREMGDINSIGEGGGSTESTLTGNTISGIDTYSYGGSGSSTTKRWTKTREGLSEPSGQSVSSENEAAISSGSVTNPQDAEAWYYEGKGRLDSLLYDPPASMRNPASPPADKLEELLFYFDKAIELNPQYLGAWYYKFKTLKALGWKTEADAAYAKVVEIGGVPG